MASLSSTSVSSSNSLGNTSLRGFGGMASGIDRDAIIEQMTLGTNTKIESQKSNMTKLQWKQEAYRGITDQILDLTDKYASYSSTSNLKDPGLFSKSLITVQGPEAATRFVTATGTSKLVENIAITAVKQLATATVRQSNAHVAGKLETDAINFNDDSDYSKLKETVLSIGTYDSRNMKFNESWKFTFDSTYTDRDGVKQTVDYLNENSEALVKQLNDMAESKGVNDQIHFSLNNGKIQLDVLKNEGDGDTAVINTNSSALSALGYERTGSSKTIKMDEFNNGVQKTFREASVGQTNTIDYLAGQSLIFEYDGNQKSIQLITKAEVEELKKLGGDAQIEKMISNIKERLNKAFGTGTIEASFSKETGDDAGYKLGFSTKEGHTVSILSSNSDLLKRLGIDFGESNKVNVDGKLGQAALGLNADTYTNANGQLDLVINGVSITGLNANSTISDILSKINSTAAAGVKATYVDATGQFMLVSNETGAGRDIILDSALAEELFGGYAPSKDGNLVDETGKILAEKDDTDGKLYLVDADGNKTSQVVDEYGRYLYDRGDNKDIFLGADGQAVNAAGYHVNNDGHLIDSAGRLINKDGNLVALDKDGNDRLIAVINIKTGKAVDPSEYNLKDDLKVDEKGNFTGSSLEELKDKGFKVKLINQDGHFVDINNNLVDQKGRQVDKDGYRLSEDRKYYVNSKGENIAYHKETEKWYRINEDGNCIVEKDGEKIAVAYDSGNWYRVDKDGYFITVDDDGNEHRIAKSDETDEHGNAIWYRVNDGYFADATNGNRLVREKVGEKETWYQIDENGYYIAENNPDKRVVKGKNEKGEDVWYLADKSGHYIDKNGNRIVKEKNEEGKDVWYQVGKNGYYLNSAGKEVMQKEDGKWYEVYANGAIIEGSTGSDIDPRVTSDGPVEGKRQEGERIAGDRIKIEDLPEVESQVSSNNIMASDGPITTGVVKSDVLKIKGLAQNKSEGKNAVIQVSYGNGVTVDMERASNTFNLEGLTVTVSGTFGGKYEKVTGEDDSGNEVTKEEWVSDSSETVTFSAKADVDKALETVKAFFEDFNALVTEINSQITARPDSNYGPLTSAQKEEMDETSIENWEKKAKQGILFNDDVMRDLSGSMEGVLSKLMNKYGVNYQDLEKIGITYSEDYLDGGTLVFDESKFRSAMESDPELVSKIISGGESGGKGLIHVVEDSLTPYATRYASKNGNSYGRLVEVAGTEKKPTTLMSNQIYKQLKEMQETIDKLQAQLKVEQDRYISQFTTMESLINQMNTQSSYLSQIMA